MDGPLKVAFLRKINRDNHSVLSLSHITIPNEWNETNRGSNLLEE